MREFNPHVHVVNRTEPTLCARQNLATGNLNINHWVKRFFRICAPSEVQVIPLGALGQMLIILMNSSKSDSRTICRVGQEREVGVVAIRQ
jgi:hypothetical protein